MKKFYSFAVMFVMAMVMFTANATNIIINVDDPSRLDYIEMNGTRYFFNGENNTSFDLPQGFATMVAKDGYIITDIYQLSGEDNHKITNPNMSDLNQQEVPFNTYPFTDGETVYVTTAEGSGEVIEEVTFSIVLENPEGIYRLEYGSSYPYKTIAESPFTSSPYSVTAKQNEMLIVEPVHTDNNTILSVKNQNNEDLIEGYSSYLNLSIKKINDGDVITIVTGTPPAKKYTIQVDDLAHLNNVQAFDYTFNKSVNDFDEDTKSLELSTNAPGVYVYTASGFVITSVSVNGADYTEVSLPASQVNLSFSDIPENALISLTTDVKPAVIYTFNNAKGVKFEFKNQSYSVYQTVVVEEDSYQVEAISSMSSIEISYSDSSKKITGITASAGDNPYGYNNVYNIYTYNYTNSTTFTIETEDVVTATFIVKVDDSSAVNMRNTNTYQMVTLSDDSDGVVVTFEENSNDKYEIGAKDYGKYLCSVTVENNGESKKLDRGYSGAFEYVPEANDVVSIKAHFEDYDVPVKVTFAEGVSSNIVNSFSVNNQSVSNWGDEDFSVKLGSQISLSINTNGYSDTSIKVNGSTLNSSSYFVENKDELVFELIGTPIPPVKTTVTCENWEALEIYLSTDRTRPVEVTGETTVFEVDPNSQYMISAKSGYYIEQYSDDHGNSSYGPSVTHTLTANAEATVTVKISSDGRDKTLVVYVEEEVLPNLMINLNNNAKYYLSASYCLAYNNLSAGYNMIAFDENDKFYFSINNYPENFEMYWNGEQMTKNSYGGSSYGYDSKENVEDNSVLKVFAGVPESHSVSYDFPEDMPLDVYHDYVTAVEGNSHSVFHGTHLVLKPRVAPAQVKATRAASANNIVVKVGDDEIAPNEDGNYVIPVEKDLTVAASYSGETGIDAIIATGETYDVFNLQGICVGSTSDVRNLPAGIYIINGQKVRL